MISSVINNVTASYPYPMNDVTVTEVAKHTNQSVNKTTIILVSVFGGLLGLCLVVCIVGLVMKRKHKRKNKTKAGKFTSTHFNPLFNR